MEESDFFNIARMRMYDRISSDEYRDQAKGEIAKGFRYYDSHGRNIDYHHSLRTTGYARRLWEQRHGVSHPECLLLGALCHDLDRLYPEEEVKTKRIIGKEYERYKQMHADNSARIFDSINNDFPDLLRLDSAYLIGRSEMGGHRGNDGLLLFNNSLSSDKAFNLEEGADIVMSADARDFIMYLLPEAYITTRSPGKVRQKIRYSLRRLSPEFREQIEDDLDILRKYEKNGNMRSGISRLVEEGLGDLTGDDFIIRE